MIDWKLETNVIDLGNGYITETFTKVDIEPIINSLTELNAFVKSRNSSLLYVQVPHKICKYDSITVKTDYSNANADELLTALSKYNIPSLDLRERIHAENLNHHDLFYKTDHHWKAETGLWAAKQIGEYLNANNDFTIDLETVSPEQYRYETYTDSFLGSAGRKVTLVRAQPEDISLLYPKFDTAISYRNMSKGIDTSGTFDILYDYHHIIHDDYYNNDPYAAYLFGRAPAAVIHNELAHDDHKLLIMIDSFGVVTVPFLAMGIKNIDYLDLRNFTGSVQSYIEQNKPDMVLVMYNPTMLDITNRKVFDFR